MKKAIVEYHGKDPVGMKEIKDFRTEASYDAFSALCANNKRKADAEEKKLQEEALAKIEEERKAENRRWAHVALLFTELAIDHGELSLSDEEYKAFKDNFNGGDIKDLPSMPAVFVLYYERLRRE